MNILFFVFFLYAFFLMPRYLTGAGYIKLPVQLNEQARQKAEFIYLTLILAGIFALVGFEKTFSASPVIQSAAANTVKAFESAFNYSDLMQPVIALALPYLFPLSYSYILSIPIFAVLIATPTNSPLFAFLLFGLFSLAQVVALGIAKKRFEPDFRVRLVHAVIGYLAWLAAVYAIPAAISAAIS